MQKGSLVNPSYLRFDFTHFSKLNKIDLQKIEEDVNAKILSNTSLQEHINLPLSKARELGAIMLFSEKYEDVVRLIQFDNSKELCAGTHVAATGEIGLFKIISETSTSSGIRRIEAITGNKALSYLNKKDTTLSEITNLVKNKDVLSAIKQLASSKKQLEKQLSELKKISALNIKSDLLNSIIEVNKIKFIGKEVNMEAEEMKNVSFELKKENNLVLVLASKIEDKALLSVMITEDLVLKGLSAISIIKEISKEIKGGGGGQVFFATAGGKNLSGIGQALKKAKEIIL